LPSNSEYLPSSSEHLPDDSEQISWKKLEDIAAPVRTRRKVPRTEVEAVIVQLCSLRFLSLQELEKLLGRQRDSLRNNYINPMLERNLLTMEIKDNRNHPRQRYGAKNLPAEPQLEK